MAGLNSTLPFSAGFFPFSCPVLKERQKIVYRPADGDGEPNHLDAKGRRQGDGQKNPEAEVGQIGDGEHGHIPRAPQNAIGDHFQTDQNVEACLLYTSRCV